MTTASETTNPQQIIKRMYKQNYTTHTHISASDCSEATNRLAKTEHKNLVMCTQFVGGDWIAWCEGRFFSGVYGWPGYTFCQVNRMFWVDFWGVVRGSGGMCALAIKSYI